MQSAQAGLKTAVAVAVALGVLALWSLTAAEAVNLGTFDVKFFDTSETLTVTVNGQAPTLLPDSHC